MISAVRVCQHSGGATLNGEEGAILKRFRFILAPFEIFVFDSENLIVMITRFGVEVNFHRELENPMTASGFFKPLEITDREPYLF